MERKDSGFFFLRSHFPAGRDDTFPTNRAHTHTRSITDECDDGDDDDGDEWMRLERNSFPIARNDVLSPEGLSECEEWDFSFVLVFVFPAFLLCLGDVFI